jgi:SAM-dependent methyltransferase
MQFVESQDQSVELRGAPFNPGALTEIHERMSQGQVHEAMMSLLPQLQPVRLRSSDQEWSEFARQCLAHPLRELVHQDPFTYRAFTRPRGYSGDAVLLDFIYGREEGWPAPPGTSELGKRIFEFTTNSMACEGVRARRGFVADALDRLVEQTPRPHVLSIACGHLREALLAAAFKRRKIGRLVAYDADPQSLEEVQRFHGTQGVEPVQGSIRQLLTGKAQLGRFDFVYSTGLFDYLPLTSAQRLTRTMFRMLHPRGRLLVANFLPGILDVGYMESYMDWKLIYRTRQDMVELSLEIPLHEIHDLRIFAEENQNIIFLEITRK